MGEKQKITINKDEFALIAAKAIKETAEMICGFDRKIYISVSALTIEKMWDMLIEMSRMNESGDI